MFVINRQPNPKEHTMNRILAAIDQTRVMIDAKALPEETLATLTKNMDFDFELWSTLNEKKNVAQSAGAITLEEAQSISAFLGSSPMEFNEQNLAVKTVLNKTLMEMVQQECSTPPKFRDPYPLGTLLTVFMNNLKKQENSNGNAF